MCRLLHLLRLLVSALVGLGTLVIGAGCVGSAASAGGKMELVRQVFPSATDIVELPMNQDDETPDRSGQAAVSAVRGPLGPLGYLVETQVTGRSGPFGIAVLLDETSTVKWATVTSYPWTHGRDVSRHSFTRQFEGKGRGDAIEVGRDIDAVTGATLSCRAMANGVRAAVDLLAKRT